MFTSAAPPVSSPSRWCSSTPAQTASREDVEETLKGHAQVRRVRVSEFFKDFDPLRSGYITKTQFRRCMDQHLGMPLSDEAYQFLVRKYDAKSNGMVNYRLFTETLESAFNPELLDGKPLEQIERYQQVPPVPTNMALSQDVKQRTDQLLQNCASYYKTQGISVRSYYQDFDRNCMGYVTRSQFHRSFPGPSDVSYSDVDLLAACYYDSSNGLCNYMKFNADIKSLWEGGKKTVTFVSSVPTLQKQQGASLESILQRISNVVYKNGIRTTEFFEDHDKLRCGIITENQFICGISLSLGQQAQLSQEEIGKLAQHYRTDDGRIHYREFCNMMEHTYNEPGLEKNPTLSVSRPLRGHLHRPLARLANEEQEQMLENVLERLRGEVKRRRLLLYTFFQDFDRHKGFTRGVTKAQFERLLSFLSLQVTPYELKLIMSKFEDPTNAGDVIYPAFVQAIDETFTGQVVEQEKPPAKQASAECTFPPDIAGDVEELLAQLKKQVLLNRIRVCESFQDFDPLRSGKISVARFRQGLSTLGLPLLSTSQFAVLRQRYVHPSQPDQILWREFVKEIDSVFQQFPEEPVFSSQPAPVDAASLDSTTNTEQEKQILATVLQRLSQRISQKRVSVKPCFQDFDRHNGGYVTKSQFRRCLACLDLPASDKELALLELSFSDAKGFNYLQFLGHLQPALTSTNMYQQRLAAMEAQKNHLEWQRSEQFHNIGPSLADQVMNRIKIKVSRERIRVLEFMQDYDKLRSGCIPATVFHRTLDLCGFVLSPLEVAALEQRYCSFKDPQSVDYIQFSDDIESIFTTKELEKMPTVEVTPFVPPHEIDLNQLSPEEEETLQGCMHRFAEQVRMRRVQLYPLFEDYDGVHIGSVTKSQFHRVLSGLELAGLFSDLEFGIVYRKFGVKIGGRSDINYTAFCGMVEQYAKSKWTDPTLQ